MDGGGKGGDGGGGEAMNPGAAGGGDGYGMGSTVYTLKQSVVCRVGFLFVCFLPVSYTHLTLPTKRIV